MRPFSRPVVDRLAGRWPVTYRVGNVWSTGEIVQEDPSSQLARVVPVDLDTGEFLEGEARDKHRSPTTPGALMRAARHT